MYPRSVVKPKQVLNRHEKHISCPLPFRHVDFPSSLDDGHCSVIVCRARDKIKSNERQNMCSARRAM